MSNYPDYGRESSRSSSRSSRSRSPTSPGEYDQNIYDEDRQLEADIYNDEEQQNLDIEAGVSASRSEFSGDESQRDENEKGKSIDPYGEYSGDDFFSDSEQDKPDKTLPPYAEELKNKRKTQINAILRQKGPLPPTSPLYDIRVTYVSLASLSVSFFISTILWIQATNVG